MTRTHVAFLRAINVGGRRLTMAALRDALAPLGFGEVATWQATGNVAFATDVGAEPTVLEDRIAATLADGLGMEVPAVVRTAAQVRAVAADVPFAPADVAATEGRVQVLFLQDRPSTEALDAVAALVPAGEQVAFVAGDLWWLPRHGVSDSGLSIGTLERLLGTATMRTHRAVAGLAAKLLD